MEQIFNHVQDFVFDELIESRSAPTRYLVYFDCTNPDLGIEYTSFFFTSTKQLFECSVRDSLDNLFKCDNVERLHRVFDFFQQLARKERLPMICQGIDPDDFSL